MEVALEALPLGVAGGHDPRPRGAELAEPCPYLGLQPLVLEREPRGRRDLLDELLVAEHATGMCDHGDGTSVPDEARLLAAGGHRDAAAVGVDELSPVPDWVGEHEARIADDPGERVP